MLLDPRIHCHTRSDANIYTNILLCTLTVRRVRGSRGFQLFWCSGRSELLKIAQGAPRAAQSRSEPLRAAQTRALGAPRAAQSRSEPLRFAQSAPRAAQSVPRAVAQNGQSCSAPLRIARSVPRAAQSRSESPRAVARSCSRNRSGSHRARPELLSAAQNRSVRAQSRSEPL